LEYNFQPLLSTIYMNFPSQKTQGYARYFLSETEK
jgi:hypothetical protein